MPSHEGKDKSMRKQDLHPRTEALNRSQKNSSDNMRLLALKWLATQFPEAFDNRRRIRPLKKGIMEDILLEAEQILSGSLSKIKLQKMILFVHILIEAFQSLDAGLFKSSLQEALGLMQDILLRTEQTTSAGLSKSKLREAVVLFTRRVDYLVCLKAKEERIDLQGKTVGTVSELEADRAALKIKKRVEKSARNARKAITAKSISYFNSKPLSSLSRGQVSEYSPFLEQRSALPTASKEAALRSSAAVTIKHKPSRNFDPSTIARLKEKLGLSSLPKEHYSSEEKSKP